MSVTKVRTIHVHDKFQDDYTYQCTEPVGKHFHPDFTPGLTPAEMLAAGVFGGVYMRDCRDEFPKAWFTHAKLAPGKADKKLNYFGVFASQPLSVWQQKGWIYHEDPRGWFQWYCRYYMGRRIPGEDDRQIRRWIKMCRHLAQIAYNCKRGDIFCRPRQHQALLQWAYDVRG